MTSKTFEPNSHSSGLINKNQGRVLVKYALRTNFCHSTKNEVFH